MHHATTIAPLLLLAGCALAASAGDDIAPIKLEHQTRHAGYDGYVYHAGLGGERIITSVDGLAHGGTVRGSSWTWDNSVVDHCVPEGYQGDISGLTAAVFAGLHSQTLGDEIDAFAVRYWSEWFEAPADTIINGLSFSTFAQIVDVDNDGDGIGDGVDGLDWFLVLTENDRVTDRFNATAHSPILVENIPGSLDDGATDGVAGDGLISFREGQLVYQFIDLNSGDVPTDIEIADTNGVSDGAFGLNSTYSGIPGADLSPADGTDDLGIGLYNCGFVTGFRQPNVAEGDGIIDRYPELAGLGLENPEGIDPQTFPNILPVGTQLSAPSSRPETNPAEIGRLTLWPLDGVAPLDAEGVGAWDAMTLIDAIGVDRSEPDSGFYFGGAVCDEAAQAALTPPFWLNPWTGYDISFNIDRRFPNGSSCCKQDLAEPWCVIDLADIVAFVTGFVQMDPIADLAAPYGSWDLADIGLFVQLFQSNECIF